MSSLVLNGFTPLKTPEEIGGRDGEIWRLIGEKDNVCSHPDKHKGKGCDGKILQYILRKKYHDQTEFRAKNREIYPAIELSSKVLKNRIASLNEDLDNQGLGRLGFDYREIDGRYIGVVPDCDALNHNNTTYAADQCYRLIFKKGDGKVESDVFIDAHATKNGLISVRKELFHDLTVHAMTIQRSCLLQGRTYPEKNKEFQNSIMVLQNDIQNRLAGAPIQAVFELVLSAHIDSFTSSIEKMVNGDFKRELLCLLENYFWIDEGKSRIARKLFHESGVAYPEDFATQRDLVLNWKLLVLDALHGGDACPNKGQELANLQMIMCSTSLDQLINNLVIT